MIDGLIFDNDGTIVDTEKLIIDSFRFTTKKVLGRDFPDEAYKAKIGIPLAEQMKDFSDDPQIQKKLLETYREYNHDKHDSSVRLFPNEQQALKRFADSGMRMGVVTSKLHWLASRGLKVTGISNFFEELIGADDCERFKPDPAPILLCMDKMELNPGHCVYIGDSPFDMQAGCSAGLKTVAVTWGVFSEADLLAESPDRICRSFEELPSVISSL